MDISVFSIYTIWASFREESWSCNRTVDFGSWIATTCGWLKSRKASNSSCFASYAIDIHANEFQPNNKAAFICTTRWRLLLEEQTYFQFPSSPVHQRRNQKNWKKKKKHFGQIHVQFVLLTVSCWVSAMNEHSLWIHISQLLCGPLE